MTQGSDKSDDRDMYPDDRQMCRREWDDGPHPAPHGPGDFGAVPEFSSLNCRLHFRNSRSVVSTAMKTK